MSAASASDSAAADRRATQYADIIDAMRRYGADSSRLGHAFAASHRLQMADLQALVAILAAERTGTPLTPSTLREHLGLSSGGTTYVIDRLERAGHVRRTRGATGDNRVVHLHHTEQGIDTALQFFRPLGAAMFNLLDEFDDEELAVVARFAESSAAMMRAHLETVERPPSES
jgi:DNA-binding MarR family transcriptional regulator